MELGGILRGRRFSIRGGVNFSWGGGGGLGPWRTLWSTKNFWLRQNLLSLTKIIWNLNRPLPALLSLWEDPYCIATKLFKSNTLGEHCLPVYHLKVDTSFGGARWDAEICWESFSVWLWWCIMLFRSWQS